MKILELFAGTSSVGRAFKARGHDVFTVDWDRDFEGIDLYRDIGTLTAQDILEKFGRPDVIWASPDCTTFSVMAISKHRRKNPQTGSLDPVTEYAKMCDRIDQHVLDLIGELAPALFFIENPVGGMRKMAWMQSLPRYTVTYCQYGETRMKPTDIWRMPAFSSGAKSTNGEKQHPTQKTWEIMAKAIEDSTEPGGIVLDTFMGSGTTAVACIKTGRAYIGFELDEGYYQIAQQRITEAVDEMLTAED